jgi:uncharacterized protein YjbI with pentapeptide repeats
MANDDHVVQIMRGREVWNAWRKENPDIVPDLRGADLRSADLRSADFLTASRREDVCRMNLRNANLQSANLRCVNLRNASLQSANLQSANLIGALLNNAVLYGADLGNALLNNAVLNGADLRSARLSGADLRRADLSNADLSSVDLTRTNLNGADLRYARLRYARLRNADLRHEDLRHADLSNADLSNADLAKANLRDADLRQAALIDTQLDGVDLTGAKLWETQRSGWSIKGVTCQQAFWDREGKEATEYEDGAFERIFAEKPRIVLRYAGGMSPVDLAMLPLIIERLQAEHPDSSLHIRSVEDDGSGAAAVTITVEDIKNRDSGAFKQEVEQLRTELRYIEGQRDLFRDQFMPIFRELVIKDGQTVIGQITNLAMIGSSMSGDTFNTGQAGAVGPNAHAHDMTFQQVQHQGALEIPRLAEELARLRAAMKREAGDAPEADEAVGAVASAQKAVAAGDGAGALQHLKNAGSWALGVAEKIGVSVAAKAIEKAMQGQPPSV